MDPNTALRNIRALCRDIDRASINAEVLDLAEELAQHIEGLDQWLSAGGFPPADWTTNSTTASQL
jgi:hypothetical protein